MCVCAHKSCVNQHDHQKNIKGCNEDEVEQLTDSLYIINVSAFPHTTQHNTTQHTFSLKMQPAHLCYLRTIKMIPNHSDD